MNTTREMNTPREIQLMLDELDQAERSIRLVTDRKSLPARVTSPLDSAVQRLESARSELVLDLGGAEREKWVRVRDEMAVGPDLAGPDGAAA